MKMVSAKARYSGFTLAELLIVMAVLGTLVAIVLPMYGRAVSISRREQCRANLHYVGSAYGAYKADEELARNGPLKAISWTQSLLPYLGSNTKALICPEDEETIGTGMPNVRLRVIYGGILYDVDYFNAYPYWMEGSHADFGYSVPVWKVNSEVYAAFGINHNAGFSSAPGFTYSPQANQFPQYTPGSSRKIYWFLMEDQRTGTNASMSGGDASLNDLHTQVRELGSGRYECYFYKDPNSAYHCDLLLPNGDVVSRIGMSPNQGPIIIIGEGELSYGMNSQVEEIQSNAHRILVIDYEAEICSTGAEIGTDEGWDLLRAPRHLGQVNVLFFSGNVITMSPDEIDPEITAIGLQYWDVDN